MSAGEGLEGISCWKDFGHRAATGVSHLGGEPFYKECSTIGCPQLKGVRSFQLENRQMSALGIVMKIPEQGEASE